MGGRAIVKRRVSVTDASVIDFAEAPQLSTERLIMRGWRESDVDPFARMSADPAVMRYFPAPLSAEQARAYVGELQARFRRWGYSLWAVETSELSFAGLVGLSQPAFEAHFTPCVEVGWRLAPAAQGQGLAAEAAREALRYGFETLGLDEIVAMVSAQNMPSRRVAERIGMRRDPADDFDYPHEDRTWRYRRSVLYRTVGLSDTFAETPN